MDTTFEYEEEPSFKKAKLQEEFVAANPVNTDKYSEISSVIQIKDNIDNNDISETDELPLKCMACCKTIRETRLYEVFTPCLVSPKLKYHSKGHNIKWEEIAFPLCKEHVHLVNIMKRRQDYPMGWDTNDILDSLSMILNDLVNDKA